MIEGNIVKLDIDAKDAVKNFSDALCDLISPASETLGLLGDTIRIARLEVAERITRKAKKIADDNGLKLKAPPLKFLLPFFESGSLEDESSLEEMWAGILASAATKFSSQHTVFLDLMRRIGPDEARAISWLGSDINPRYAAQFELFQETATPERMTQELGSLLRERGSVTADDAIKFIESFFVQSNQIFVAARMKTPDGKSFRMLSDDYAKNGTAYETLRHLGLVRDVNLSFHFGQHFFSVKGYAPTRLCVDFLIASEGGLPEGVGPASNKSFQV